MYIKTISIRNFRILSESKMDFGKNPCLMIGRNNTGKTSFMVLFEKFLSELSFDFNDFSVKQREKILRFDSNTDETEENCESVTGKREYDKNPAMYNQTLNKKIEVLNKIISGIIEEKDYSGIVYNETKFDSLGELSYGHDGLIAIFHLLFEKYPMLGKIISDKYDYLFIDEYQDTRAEILSDMLKLSSKYNLTIGLFGDSMQSIYDNGIGSLDAYVKTEILDEIPKADNYRCSYEVIKLINPLRLDGITQDVAFKKLSNGSYETEADRHGVVKVLYSVTESRPTARSTPEEKEQFQALINNLIDEAQKIGLFPKKCG